MTEEEFNLSERFVYLDNPKGVSIEFISTKDVKEFIRLLKEEIKKIAPDYETTWITEPFYRIIDKLAGDKLCN